MNPLIATLSGDLRHAVKIAPQPVSVKPMLATPGGQPFFDPHWIFEYKFDGERCIAYHTGNNVRLYSRNQLQLNQKYPEIVNAVQAQAGVDFIIDGEVVALKGGISSFSALQQRINISSPDEAIQQAIPVYYYIFDLLYLDGYDLTGLPLLTRKALLQAVFSFGGRILFSNHRQADGKNCYHLACRRGFEGIIAKRANSRYLQQRSQDWIKFKCQMRQEFVIGGYTEPKNSRQGFGAILIGYYQGGVLVYAGKVGTGFDDTALQTLSEVFHPLERPENPFTGKTDGERVHFIRPVLVAEIGFTSWTPAGRLRHPHFIGIRPDKNAHEVVREHIDHWTPQ